MGDAATPAAPQKQSEPTADSLLKIVGSAITITIATFYAVGIIATNAYLASIGVSDFNIFKSKCVLTGAWTTPLLLAVSAPGILYYRLLSREGSKIKKVHFILVPSFVAIGFCAFTIVSSLVNIELTTNPIMVYTAGTGLFLAVPILSIILNAIKEHRDPASYRAGWFVIALLLIVVVIDIGFFIYPQASSAFGGGKPQKAMLILNHEGVATWSKLPGSPDYDALAKKAGASVSVPGSDPVLTPEIEILYENDSQLVIRWNPKDSHSVVMLDKKLVSAVLPARTSGFSFWIR